MPFDALTTHLTLSDAARRLGIIPIPRSVLDTHKQAELRKHPGSWWYYHTELAAAVLFFGFCVSMFTAFASAILSLSAILGGRTVLGSICLVVAIASMFI